MGILPDWMIRQANAITPLEEGAKRPGKVSWGLGSYGVDFRVGYQFKVFTNVNSTVIDPKNFDERSFVTVDLTPLPDGGHKWVVGDHHSSEEWMICQHCEVPKSDFDKGYSLECEAADDRKPPDHVIIPPNSFALGCSVEDFDIPRDCLAICLGKSTYARCGIVVNFTPLEPEWKGKLTIEISNTTPLPAKIYAGEGIAQMLLFRSDGHCDMMIDRIRSLYRLTGHGRMFSIEGAMPMTKTACDVSYKDKQGKYQDQTDTTLPRVD